MSFYQTQMAYLNYCSTQFYSNIPSMVRALWSSNELYQFSSKPLYRFVSLQLFIIVRHNSWFQISHLASILGSYMFSEVCHHGNYVAFSLFLSLGCWLLCPLKSNRKATPQMMTLYNPFGNLIEHNSNSFQQVSTLLIAPSPLPVSTMKVAEKLEHFHLSHYVPLQFSRSPLAPLHRALCIQQATTADSSLIGCVCPL